MIASENRQAVGLCSTCNNNPDCFHRARRGPALFCEMYDDYMGLPVVGNPERATRLGRGAAGAEDAASGAGLCVNCENRNICNLPKPAGGVWHCENYE
jgi:hypothetical protein